MFLPGVQRKSAAPCRCTYAKSTVESNCPADAFSLATKGACIAKARLWSLANLYLRVRLAPNVPFLRRRVDFLPLGMNSAMCSGEQVMVVQRWIWHLLAAGWDGIRTASQWVKVMAHAIE